MHFYLILGHISPRSDSRLTRTPTCPPQKNANSRACGSPDLVVMVLLTLVLVFAAVVNWCYKRPVLLVVVQGVEPEDGLILVLGRPWSLMH